MATTSLTKPKSFDLDEALHSLGINTPDVISYLRSSDDDDIKRLVRTYDEGTSGDISYLCQRQSLSPIKVMETLVAEMKHLRNLFGTVMLLNAVDEVAQATIKSALNERIGFRDRQLLLQIAGIAPIPRNQVMNLTIDGNVDARAQQQINFSVPRLEDIVKNLDAVGRKLKGESDEGNSADEG